MTLESECRNFTAKHPIRSTAPCAVLLWKRVMTVEISSQAFVENDKPVVYVLLDNEICALVEIRFFDCPTPDDIRNLAYSIWLRQGQPGGKALDNWIEAEAELVERMAGHGRG